MQTVVIKWLCTQAVKINTNPFLFPPPFIILHFWNHLNTSSPTLQIPCQLLPVQYWDSVEQSKFVCVCVCFFHRLCLYGFFFTVLQVFRRLVIFCLVAPNMLLCLSALADTADLYKCRKLQQIVRRGNSTRWQVTVCKKGVRWMCRTDSQMLEILSDMKCSQPRKMWQMPLGR